MSGAEIAILFLFVFTLSFDLAKHGEPKESEEHNFFHALFGCALWFGLLWWGGFWSFM